MGKGIRLAIVLLVIVIVLALFWIIGGVAKNQKNNDQTEYYANLVKEDRELQALIQKNLEIKGLLLDLDDLQTASSTINYFSTGDIELIDDINEINIKQYGTQIGQVLKKYREPRANEIILMLETLRTVDPNLTAELLKTRDLHQAAVNELLLIPVPKNAQIVHLRLLNILKRLTDNLENMSRVIDEPKLALQSGEEYIKNYALFFRAVEGINVYFTKQGIIFNKDEMTEIYDSVGIIEENNQ